MLPLIVLHRLDDDFETYIEKFIVDNLIRIYNISRIRPVKTELTIDQVRAVRKEISRFSSETRLYILYSFDMASLEAQNSLLKTLEERNISNQFILGAKNAERILPTIKSRASIVTVGTSDIQVVRDETDNFLTRFVKDKTFDFMADPLVQAPVKEQAVLFFDECMLFFRTVLKEGNASAVPVIKKASSTKELLQNNNLNPQMAVDAFLIWARKQSLDF